jgi:hypothetical protein
MVVPTIFEAQLTEGGVGEIAPLQYNTPRERVRSNGRVFKGGYYVFWCTLFQTRRIREIAMRLKLITCSGIALMFSAAAAAQTVIPVDAVGDVSFFSDAFPSGCNPSGTTTNSTPSVATISPATFTNTGGFLNFTITGVSNGTDVITINITSFGSSSACLLSLPYAITLDVQVGPAPPLQIPGGGGAATVTLTAGTVGTPYSQTLPASNGNPPYSWSVLGGALPPSLSLSSSGTLSGTPSQAGTFEFTGEVTDTSGTSASSIFGITIAPQALSITTVSPLPTGIAGSDYPAQVFNAAGGNAPYTFQISGSLPAGLIFSNGEISGVPTAAAASSFTVTATDSSSPALMASSPFQLTVEAADTDLIVSQGSLAFSLSTGAAGVPPGANVSVRSSVATQPLNYSVSVMPAAAWLDESGGGSTPGIIQIGLDPSALSLGAGVSTTSVVVTCVAPSPCAGYSRTISVSLTVAAAPPQLFVTTSLLSFTAQASNPQPVSLTMGLQNKGGGTITVNSVTAADSFVMIAGAPFTLAAEPDGRLSPKHHFGKNVRRLGQRSCDGTRRAESNHDPEPGRNAVPAGGRFFAGQPQRLVSGHRFRELDGELDRHPASPPRRKLAHAEYVQWKLHLGESRRGEFLD